MAEGRCDDAVVELALDRVVEAVVRESTVTLGMPISVAAAAVAAVEVAVASADSLVTLPPDAALAADDL